MQKLLVVVAFSKGIGRVDIVIDDDVVLGFGAEFIGELFGFEGLRLLEGFFLGRGSEGRFFWGFEL